MHDNDLERAIDEVGRDRVFQRAKDIGWRSSDDPPKWVWWGIVAELRSALSCRCITEAKENAVNKG